MALKGATFCITGTLSKGRKEVEADIKKHGGAVSGSVTGKVTHVLATQAEIDSSTSKIAAAQAKSIPIVKEDFLWDAVKARKLPAVDKYTFGSAGGGGAVKSKAVAAPADTPPAKKAKTAKGVAEVNPKSGLEDKAEVHCDGDVVYDAEMIEKDDSKNMDKFYDMQVLHNTEDDDYVCFQHWGRTGTAGQCHTDGPSTLDAAVAVFQKKFREKSGYAFTDGSYSPAKAGKYTVLQRMERDAVEHTWEYYVDKPVDGKRVGWYPYDGAAVTNMERFHSQFKANPDMGPRYVFSGSWNYEVDFVRMQQTNVDHPNHTTRQIRRVPK